MLNIYKCPNCGAPALCRPQLSDAAPIKCSKCGFSDYLKAFKTEKQDDAKSCTPELGADFLRQTAGIAQSVNSLSMQGSLDGFIKDTCREYIISPWTMIECINAYLKPPTNASPNPLRFVTLESGRARIDDLLKALKEESQSVRTTAGKPASAQASSDAGEWIERYSQLQEELQKKEKSYQTLLAAYRQAVATLEENGLA
ncbi:MAG: hypothetical protein NC102_07360 [Clostridium sp.]|nr:hypothetical protein [Clostridium sp.]